MAIEIIQKKLKVYKGVIKDEEGNESQGVTYTALVDSPATEMLWQMFNESKLEFSVISKEKRLVSGVMMKAGMPIYRMDATGEYMILFDSEGIEKIAHKFMKDQNSKNVNLMHDSKQKVGGAYMVESFLVDSKRGIKAPEGYGNIPDGSWFGTFKIEDNKVWEQIKRGEFKGFSVEGEFFQREVSEQPEETLKELDNRLKAIKARLENKIA